MTAQITDHVAQAVARLAGRDAKPNMIAFISLLVGQTQSGEDAWYQLLVERGISGSVGAQLDDIGLIVGEPRNGLSDADYQRHLSARIAANNSDGLIEDFIRVARSVLADATLGIELEAQYPAALVMHVVGALDASIADILIAFLRDTRAGGVRIQAHHMIGDEADTFETGSATIISSLTPLGSTSVVVPTTADFPASGSLILEYLGATPETWAYTSKSGNTFYGGATTQAHSFGDIVKVADSGTQGTSDTTAPTVGGELSSVLE